MLETEARRTYSATQPSEKIFYAPAAHFKDSKLCVSLAFTSSVPFSIHFSVRVLQIIKLFRQQQSQTMLCVICSRKQTQFLYYDMVFNKSVFNGVIQRYGNLSGPGEYASECLLKCTRNSDIACMPKPIMSHQRNRYTVHMHPEHGIYYLKQVRVSGEDHVPNFPLASAAAHQARAHATCQTLFQLEITE